MDMLAQDLAQGLLQQVGGGVVATEQTAAGEVVTDKDGVTLRKRADELALMDVQTALGDSVIDEELGVDGVDKAVVTHLAAISAYRGCDRARRSLRDVLGALDTLAVHDDSEDLRASMLSLS